MDRTDVSRRAFVAGAATIAAVAGGSSPAAAADAMPAPSPSALPSAAPGTFDTVAYDFDLAGFTALLNQPYPHRQLYAATSFDRAADALNLMSNSLRAYGDPRGFNAGSKGLHVAAVWYHGLSTLLALDDAMWAAYPLTAAIAALAARDGGEKPPSGAAKTATTNLHADTYRDLVAQHGASFFVCNNALSGIAGYLAKQLAAPGTVVTRERVVAIHTDLAGHFLPGTSLVPAGVAAINAAQEARFTFLPA